MIELQEQIAHLEKTVDEISTVVVRQEREIAMLTQRVQLLMEREAEREASQGDAVVFGDERPPHY